MLITWSETASFLLEEIGDFLEQATSSRALAGLPSEVSKV